MAKRYNHLKIEEDIMKEFKKVKKMYELQDGKDYTQTEILSLLIEHRKKTLFTLPSLELIGKKEL